MTRAEKTETIELLKEKFAQYETFYVTDSSSLSVAQVNKFRRLCYDQSVEFCVVKNTLVQKALETFDDVKNYEGVYPFLKGTSAIMFSNTGNVPAKILDKFRKENEKPVLKVAYVESAIFAGDEQLKSLTALKSKFELVGDIIGLLQSPAKNIIGALKSGGHTIAGLVKALEEKAQ